MNTATQILSVVILNKTTEIQFEIQLWPSHKIAQQANGVDPLGVAPMVPD